MNCGRTNSTDYLLTNNSVLHAHIGVHGIPTCISSYSEVCVCNDVFCVFPLCRYTSLDGMHDTHPNPSLLVAASGGPNGITPTMALGSAEGRSYLPAYMLYDEGLERAGRTSKKSAL